jgi:hypothetical protein
MNYDNLPIYKLALDLCVYVETIVKSFVLALLWNSATLDDKYFKYTVGSDLREYSKRILFAIHKANRSYEKSLLLEKLVDYCEEFKMLVQLCKELKVFKSFKQFEFLSKKSVEMAKQSQAWYNYFSKQNPSSVGVLK